jgi:hypothetical protein
MVTARFSPFQIFGQITYVTTDCDLTLQMFADRYSVADWLLMRDTQVQTSTESTCVSHIALAYVGDIQLELIQPLRGDTAMYRSVLPNNPFGVHFHHVAQILDTETELNEAEVTALTNDTPIVMRGVSGGGFVRYFFTDHRDTLGHYVEHIWYAPAAREFFTQIPRN